MPNYFYHANLNLRTEQALTAAQWERAVDVLESHLGLAGQARFVVEHAKAVRSGRLWRRAAIGGTFVWSITGGMNKSSQENLAAFFFAFFPFLSSP